MTHDMAMIDPTDPLGWLALADYHEETGGDSGSIERFRRRAALLTGRATLSSKLVIHSWMQANALPSPMAVTPAVRVEASGDGGGGWLFFDLASSHRHPSWPVLQPGESRVMLTIGKVVFHLRGKDTRCFMHPIDMNDHCLPEGL